MILSSGNACGPHRQPMPRAFASNGAGPCNRELRIVLGDVRLHNFPALMPRQTLTGLPCPPWLALPSWLPIVRRGTEPGGVPANSPLFPDLFATASRCQATTSGTPRPACRCKSMRISRRTSRTVADYDGSILYPGAACVPDRPDQGPAGRMTKSHTRLLRRNQTGGSFSESNMADVIGVPQVIDCIGDADCC